MKLTDLNYSSILEARLAELETLFAEKTEEGIDFFVASSNRLVRFQANEKSVTRISAVIQGIALAENLGIVVSSFDFTDRENTIHSLSISELKLLCIEIGQFFASCHYTKCRVREALLQNLDLDIVGEWG